MKNILVIGGTRNMGHQLVHELLEAGHQVTVLNRGLGPDDLPDEVHRLRADRTDHQQMQRALLARSFDVVVDFVVFNGREAETIMHLLRDRVEHYIFISSGQVYLVREGEERPFTEEMYAGRTQPPPKEITYAYEEWRYGMGKREAEDAFAKGHADFGFPYTSLRLPMVNSERDPFNRLYNYILRLQDNGPILIPQKPNYPLRHVYGYDVVRMIKLLIDSEQGKGRAYNVSQDETLTIYEFLAILGEILEVKPYLVRIKRRELDAAGFLPDCSPFSDRWMSELTNERSKSELGMTYTPVATYLKKLVEYYTETKPPIPLGYKRRSAEIQLVETHVR